jgi:hypothetical protein
MSYSANKATGLLYILPAVAVLGIWYILLFAGNSSAHTSIDTIAYFLSGQTNEMILSRWMLVAFPLLCIALSIAYFSRIPRIRGGAIVLFFAGVLLALVAWGTVSPGLAGLVSAPLFIAFKEVRRHLASHSSDTPDGDR